MSTFRPNARRVSFLLGAGASVDAGLPMAAQLTNMIIESVGGQTRDILEFVRSGIEMQRSANAVLGGRRGGATRVDSEALFNAVSDLVYRDELDIYPFVSAWHPLLDSFHNRDTEVREIGKELNEFQRETVSEARKRESRGPISLSRHGRALAQHIAAPTRSDGLPAGILQSVMSAVVKAVSLNEPPGVEYLSPLVEIAKRSSSPVTVATLNYDQTVEAAGESYGVKVSDGVSTTPGDRELDFEDASIRLLKLHGSRNWVHREYGVARVEPADDPLSFRRQAILFGGRNKLTAEWPFLDLLWAWNQELKECDDLCIIGYSYRDDHVNEILKSWFDRAPGRRVFLIDPTVWDDTTHPLGWRVKSDSFLSDRHWEPSVSSPSRRSVLGPPDSPHFYPYPHGAREGLRKLKDDFF